MTTMAGRTVLITGSSRGIGAATARAIAAKGARVVLHGRTQSDALGLLAKELEASWITCDVADRTAVHAAVAEVLDTSGPIDGLVNCAGQVTPKPFLEMTEDDFAGDLATNLMGTAWFCQAVLPSMIDAGYGRIANVASMRGVAELAGTHNANYSASKAGVINLTASLAKSFAPVTVNCVAPGFIETDMAKSWPPHIRELATTSLAGRAGQPDDIGAVLAFLVSDEAAFMTGQTLLVDGGYAMAGK
jgi:3-oxoacyl-[acyl-carrier protein] reductase